MAILHKNISAEGDIHNPKWFSGANNGDVAWRNELGVLESTDELVLPAALNFVDGSAAPPTSNSGDIYVLSSGASVNAGWGTVALGDWVRYDGTTWNDITPQKSTLCYNETLDALISYTGSEWSAIGGNTIYTADDTLTGDRIVDLDGNDLQITGVRNDLYLKSTNTLLSYKDSSSNELCFINMNINDFQIGFDTNFEIINLNNTSHKPILISANTDYVLKIENVGTTLGNASNAIYNNLGSYGLTRGGTYRQRVKNALTVICGNKTLITNNAYTESFVGSENISIQGSTAIKGIGTAGSSALAIYDNDTTPAKVFEILDDSTIKTNGNVGFTGTGAYTNFTIENGIITNAT